MPAEFWSRVREARLLRVLAVYLAGSWLILQVTALLREEFQLPRWVTPLAVVLLLIGLVVISATAWIQSHPLTAGRARREEVPGSWEIDLGDVKESVSRGRLPHLTWARSILGGVVAFSLLFGLAGVYVLVKDRGRTFSPEVAVAGDAAPGIAVLPFTVRDPDLATWREGMVDLLSTNLDGVRGLRAIDSRTVLARWREQVQGDTAPDLATALEVARRAGGRYALVGSAVSSGAGMRLAADIYDLQTSASLGEAQVEGSADSLFALVDRLSIEALGAVLEDRGGDLPRVDLARVTTASLPALKAFLDGETLFRRSDFEGAIPFYQRALEADSSFALALGRLAAAYGWSESILSELAVQYAERAARHADRLPEREALLARAGLALERGTLDALEIAEQATARYPDDVEAWMLLGEVYWHLGEQGLSGEHGEQAFTRAVELDPTFAPAYLHLIDAAFTVHADSAGADSLIRTYVRLAPDSPTARADLLAFRLAFTDRAGREEALARIDSFPADLLIAASLSALDHPRFLDVRERVLTNVRRRPEGSRLDVAFIHLFFTRHARGKLQAALDMLEGRLAPMAFVPAGLYLVRMADPSDRAGGLERQPIPLAPAGPRDVAGLRVYPEFFLGAVAADRGEWEQHELAVQQLRERGADLLARGDSSEARFSAGAARGLEGYGLWKRGSPGEAERLLVEAQRQATGHGPKAGVNSIIRWWLGELSLETGRLQEAERYFSSLGGDPLALRALGGIYEALGEYDQARNAYELFAVAWQDADPELQPQVEEARAAVQRLTSVIRE